jgi:hypothetical protein
VVAEEGRPASGGELLGGDEDAPELAYLLAVEVFKQSQSQGKVKGQIKLISLTIGQDRRSIAPDLARKESLR